MPQSNGVSVDGTAGADVPRRCALHGVHARSHPPALPPARTSTATQRERVDHADHRESPAALSLGYGPRMPDRVRIPVGGRGLVSERVAEVLGSAGDDVRVESDAGARRSVDMDTGTVSMVVDLATAVPALLTAVAGAWSQLQEALVAVAGAGDGRRGDGG